MDLQSLNESEHYWFAQWLRGSYYNPIEDPDRIFINTEIKVVRLARDSEGDYSYDGVFKEDEVENVPEFDEHGNTIQTKAPFSPLIVDIADPDGHFPPPEGDEVSLYKEYETTEEIIEKFKNQAREWYTQGLPEKLLLRFEQAEVTTTGGGLGAITAAARIEAELNTSIFKDINENKNLKPLEKQQYIKEMLPRLRAAIINPKTHKIRERTAKAFWKNFLKYIEQEREQLHIFESKIIVRVPRTVTDSFKTVHPNKTRLDKLPERVKKFLMFLDMFDSYISALPPEKQIEEFNNYMNKINHYALADCTGDQINAFLAMLATARAAQLNYANTPWNLNVNTTGTLSRFEGKLNRPDQLLVNSNVILQAMGKFTNSPRQNSRIRDNMREQLKSMSAQTYIITHRIKDPKTGKTRLEEKVTQLFSFTSNRDDPESVKDIEPLRGAEYWTFSGISNMLLPLDIQHAQYEKTYLRPGAWINQNSKDKRSSSAISKDAFWIMLRLNDFKNAAEMDHTKQHCIYEDDLTVLSLHDPKHPRKTGERLDLLQQALKEIDVALTWEGNQFKAVMRMPPPDTITIGGVVTKGEDAAAMAIIQTEIKKTVRKEVKKEFQRQKNGSPKGDKNQKS